MLREWTRCSAHGPSCTFHHVVPESLLVCAPLLGLRYAGYTILTHVHRLMPAYIQNHIKRGQRQIDNDEDNDRGGGCGVDANSYDKIDDDNEDDETGDDDNNDS